MYRKAYIIVFDRNDIDVAQLHRIIVALRSHGIINNWWHHIKTCYILISEKSAADLSERIGNSLASGKKYFLIEINMNNRQGWLTQEAWDWINEEKSKLH